MKWVLRERPKVDRIACPWLIARFIDERPEFLDAPADRVPAVADEPGATPCCRVRQSRRRRGVDTQGAVQRAGLAVALAIGAALVGSGTALASAPARDPVLVLEATIPLAEVGGRIDHMAVDLHHGHLFVAELGNDTVDVVDLTGRQRVGRITGLKEPQGVGYLPTRDLVAVANAGDGSVRFFRGADLTPTGAVPLGDDADNVRIDPRTGEVLVGYGAGAIAVLDPERPAKTADLPLPAHPEGFRYDPNSGRLYVNVPDKRRIVVLDRKTGKEVAAWTVADLRSNFPMALDEAGGRIAIGYRSPARLVEVDAGNGTMTGSIDVCGDTDDVFFDARRARYYVSCGEGAVDVVDRTGNGLVRRDRIKTASGARTALFVPELDRLFVAARAGGLGSDAAILVFRPESQLGKRSR